MENETIDFRLDKIEKAIEELKSIVVESKIQRHDIDDMKSDILKWENKIDTLEIKMRAIESRPEKERAQKWQYIIDYVLKTLIALAVGALLVKMGLK